MGENGFKNVRLLHENGHNLKKSKSQKHNSIINTQTKRSTPAVPPAHAQLPKNYLYTDGTLLKKSCFSLSPMNAKGNMTAKCGQFK